MTKLSNFVLAATLAVFATASAAETVDVTKLRNDSRVHDELLGASIAYLIDENCSSIRLRKLTLLNRAFSLRKHAMSLGYSSSEVMAYVDSKTEQARFRSIAEPMLAKQGAVSGNEETYCTIGRAEIEKGSFAGSLLSSR